MAQTIVSPKSPISLPQDVPPRVTTPVEQREIRQRAGLEDLLALVATLADAAMPVPDLNILVVQPTAFEGEDWDLAASSLGLEARVDVISTTETAPEHVCRVAAIMRPDAIVLDWRASDSPALFEAIHTEAETTRIPVMIISADGEQAAPRMLCGVWEDPAPEDFDEVVHLLDAINTRTMLTRLAPHADPAELEAWFDWVTDEKR